MSGDRIVIYFVQAGGNGPVKIGRANSIQARMVSLQSSNAETLLLINSLEGNGDLERRLHFFFRAAVIRGEWFRFDPRMLTVTAAEVAHLPARAPPRDLRRAEQIMITHPSAEVLAEQLTRAACAGVGVTSALYGRLKNEARARGLSPEELACLLIREGLATPMQKQAVVDQPLPPESIGVTPPAERLASILSFHNIGDLMVAPPVEREMVALSFKSGPLPARRRA